MTFVELYVPAEKVSGGLLVQMLAGNEPLEAAGQQVVVGTDVRSRVPLTEERWRC